MNVQDFIENGNLFKKFKVDELLFTEIKCPVDDDESSGELWWHDNFFAYALAGEMVLKTLNGEHIFKAGDCIFAKKGGLISARHRIQEDFCELRVFVPDDFIRSVFQRNRLSINVTESHDNTDTIIPIPLNDLLLAYFHSLLPYFQLSDPPSENLLKLKFEELIISIASNKETTMLKSYFSKICGSSKPSIKNIMERNFIKNLTLQEFARLCGRSLSTFKVEFKTIYHTTPGKWLRKKRLEYGRYLLETTESSVAEVCYDSGFENTSHFIRVFKWEYGLTPSQFRMK